MQINNITTDAAIAAAGSKATYGGLAGSIGSWLLSSEAGVLIGIVIGITGLMVNIYFKRREDARLEQEHQQRTAEHDARMSAIVERRTQTVH